MQATTPTSTRRLTAVDGVGDVGKLGGTQAYGLDTGQPGGGGNDGAGGCGDEGAGGWGHTGA